MDNTIEKKTLEKVQTFARKLRKQWHKDFQNFDYTIPIGYEERIGHLNDEPVRRIILYLRSSGCGWAEKTGGCTMCGFYCATSGGKRVSTDEYLFQVNTILDKIDLNDYPIVCIYNDGNIFNEKEMSIKTLENICGLINKYKDVKKVVLESRLEYVIVEKVRKIKKILNKKQIEIAFGFESINQTIMNLCINKGFSLMRFNTFYDSMKNIRVNIKPLLLLKPPFLTESESIDDVLSTIRYLSLKGIKYVDLEATTVQKNTVLYALWKNNFYRPPWLWSIVDILLRYRKIYGDSIGLYISPWKYSVESIDEPRNCGKCDEKVKEAINYYNYNFDITMIKRLECSCKNRWNEYIKETNNLTIPERIINQLDAIKCEEGDYHNE